MYSHVHKARSNRFTLSFKVNEKLSVTYKTNLTIFNLAKKLPHFIKIYYTYLKYLKLLCRAEL